MVAKSGSTGVTVRCVIPAVIVLSIVVTGCTPPTSFTTDQTPTPATTTAHAVLDWDTANVILPLDRYGMTPDETIVMDAAKSIAFAQCVSGADGVSAAVIQEASRFLHTVPIVNHARYGYWDVPYVAQHGFTGSRDVPVSLVSTDPNTGANCMASVSAEGYESISGTQMNPSSELLLDGSGQSYDALWKDARVDSIRVQYLACIAAAGYATDSRRGGGVAYDPAWADARIQIAAIAEATCADRLNYTQQVGDVEASIQTGYIAQHEADLVALRAECDRRVALAHDLLHHVGLE